jgi:4,5-DOPA dioxygenase extradiol
MTTSSQPMPAIFFGHGNPMYALESNRYTAAWRAVGASLPRPAAILAVSAHWYIRACRVTAMARPRTIHDFGGFPRALFEVQYPAAGSPVLAQRVRELLAPVADVQLDEDAAQGWGVDHGTWSVLVHAFPLADVPVVQLSIDARQAPAWHYALAQRLLPLRDEGVLIVGSGNIVHNLGLLIWSADAPPFDWARRFSEFVYARVLAGDHGPLIDYLSAGDDARLSVPTPDHYLPLLYVLAQQQPGEPVSFPVSGIDMGAIDMRSVAVGLEEKVSRPG